MLITKFMTRVLGNAPGAPTELVRQALVDAAVEFCQKSRCWNDVMEAIPLLDDVNEYDYDFPSGARPMSVESIWCGTRELIPLDTLTLSRVMPDWATAEGPEPIYYNSDADWDTVRVYPRPMEVESGTLRIKGSFQPKDDATVLPDFMWHRYREGIASGALKRLLVMPGYTFTNPQLAQYHSDQFTACIEDAKIAVLHGNVSGTVFVPPRRFG